MISGPLRSEWTAACVAGHCGVWAINPSTARALSSTIIAGRMPLAATVRQDDFGPTPEEVDLSKVRAMWRVDGSGLGVLSLVGPMQKFDSKFGGVNTLRARKIIRTAMQSDAVKAVLVLVDSPGGSADGTLELAADIKALSEKKPTATHVAGMMASAALWVGVQAPRVTAGPADLVGSIGTYAVVEDWSKNYADQGIVVDVIAAGGMEDGGVKGQGVDGVPVSEEYRAEIRKIVDGLNELFLQGVADGRGLAIDAVRQLADGRVHLGPEAVKLGLVDAIETADQAAATLMSRVEQSPKSGSTRVARARLELDR